MAAGVARWKWIALLVAVALLVVALLTSGGSSPAVATVNGQKITLSTYRSWLTTAAGALHAQSAEVPSFPPDAPDYKRCTAYLVSYTRAHSKKALSQADARKNCVQLRTVLAEDVMGMLISSSWYLQQAAKEHVSVSAAAVDKAVQGSIPKGSTLVHILKSASMSKAQLTYEARTSLLAQKLMTQHAGSTPNISAGQISAYYDQNKSQMGKETLSQASPAIKQLLIAQAQSPTVNAYLQKVQKYFAARTTCAPGYRIAQYCHA